MPLFCRGGAGGGWGAIRAQAPHPCASIPAPPRGFPSSSSLSSGVPSDAQNDWRSGVEMLRVDGVMSATAGVSCDVDAVSQPPDPAEPGQVDGVADGLQAVGNHVEWRGR